MDHGRLAQAVANGAASFGPSGRIAVFRPTRQNDLSALPADRVRVIQGFYPDHAHFRALGFDVATEAAAGDDWGAALVCLPRARAEGRALVAEALALTGGGPVVIDGAKVHGIDAMLRDCRRRGGEIGEVHAKGHGKTFTLRTAGEGAAPGDPWADWRAAPGAGPEGFVTRPGVFSADAVDPGSALLAAQLPPLSGRVADLGAGWGYLARAVLERSPKVEALDLVEAEMAALDCARQNVADPRARFHWADATAWDGGAAGGGAADGGLSHVVTNPPFHQGRAAEPGLGRAFIAAAARILARNGTLWLVANRHLPYEAALSAAFTEVSEVGSDGAYKVFRAARPRRARH